MEKKEFELEIPERIPIIPVRNTVFFPHQFIPLAIGRPKSLRLIEHALRENTLIGVVAQLEGAIDDPKPEDLYTIGTIAKILKVIDLPDGSKSAFIQGISRFKIKEFVQTEPFFMAGGNCGPGDCLYQFTGRGKTGSTGNCRCGKTPGTGNLFIQPLSANAGAG